jgi:CMP-N-acetylneuraminate monooxygenase
MPFGKPFELPGGLRLTAFEPASLWNDAILLAEFDGFRFLNLNDAGLNPRLAGVFGAVDVIALGFSPGASGYPQTWTHLDPERVEQIMKESQSGSLEMLSDATELHGAWAVLPFASHFALWHPGHRRFALEMRKNTLDDVVAHFEGSDVRVLDLMPGERWNARTDEIMRTFVKRARLYERDVLGAFVERRFDAEVFGRHHPVQPALSPAEVDAYFLRLNDVPEMRFCEDLRFTVEVSGPEGSVATSSFSYAVADGHLSVAAAGEAQLRIGIPGNILAEIIRENLSWDEAHIGYWCRFWRSPDTYHANFWRLLQTPYYVRPSKVELAPLPGRLEGESVASLLEGAVGLQVDRVLRRHGLYCHGCVHSPAETLASAATAHGLTPTALRRLAAELREIVAPPEGE